jgi:hypothetical protein
VSRTVRVNVTVEIDMRMPPARSNWQSRTFCVFGSSTYEHISLPSAGDNNLTSTDRVVTWWPTTNKHDRPGRPHPYPSIHLKCTAPRRRLFFT